MQRSTYLSGSSVISVMLSLADEHSKLSLVIASILYLGLAGPPLLTSFLEMDYWGWALDRDSLLLDCLVTLLASVCFIFPQSYITMDSHSPRALFFPRVDEAKINQLKL